MILMLAPASNLVIVLRRGHHFLLGFQSNAGCCTQARKTLSPSAAPPQAQQQALGAAAVSPSPGCRGKPLVEPEVDLVIVMTD